MPDDFDDIVAELREEGVGGPAPRSTGHRKTFIAGLVCIAAAIVIFIFGGVEGAVLAIFPWIVGMLLVVAGRSRTP